MLHSCCAPCSGEVIEAMVASGLELEIFFYNPNIHPREEFYAQQYCGCVYSLRDTNKWRLANGRPKVVIGQDYYRKEGAQPVIDRELPKESA